MRTLLVCVVSTLGAVIGLASVANATSITFLATGTVTSVPGELAGVFSVGDAMTALYTFDSAAVDTLPADPGIGRYATTISSFSVGSYSGTSNGGLIDVRHGLNNSYFARVSQPDIIGPDVAGLPLTGLQIIAISVSGAAPFENDSLPLTPPELSDFEILNFNLSFDETSFVVGSFTSLTLVPEPSTALLLGTGLLAMSATRRR